jgi:16S rRNA U516 pseudouridylate synthase RsuA-like enzyme
MTAAVGHPTLRLIRTSMRAGDGPAAAAVDLHDLQPGAWQWLSDAAARRLWRAVQADSRR